MSHVHLGRVASCARLHVGELRLILLDCRATIGQVSNPLNKLVNLGKAGANRQRGRRPKVGASTRLLAVVQHSDPITELIMVDR